MPSYDDDRLKTAKTLDSIAAAITQTSPQVQNKLTSVLAGKLGALGTAGGIMGLLSFGTASTGTAIASLSGAAATTAKLFWVGSIVGGGVAVGAAAIGPASLIGGYLAASKGKKLLLGEAREEDKLEPEEKLILSTCRKVSIALQVESSVSKSDFIQICDVFLSPLLVDIDEFYFHDVEASKLFNVVNKTIKPYYLSKLFYHRAVLGGIVSRYC